MVIFLGIDLGQNLVCRNVSAIELDRLFGRGFRGGKIAQDELRVSQLAMMRRIGGIELNSPPGGGRGLSRLIQEQVSHAHLKISEWLVGFESDRLVEMLHRALVILLLHL